MIEFLMVADAPTPVAPFSHATAAGGWLFVTGQMPTDPADDSAPLPDGIEAQLPSPLASRDRACPSHPRLLGIDCSKKDVDARHKAGHGVICESRRSRSSSLAAAALDDMAQRFDADAVTEIAEPFTVEP